MDESRSKVFAQAKALWTPEIGTMRKAFDIRKEAINREAAITVGFGSGNRVVLQANAAAAEIEARGAKVLESLFEAHKVVGNIRTKTYSVRTFTEWYSARLDEEVADVRRNPPLVTGHADAVQHYIGAITEAVQLAKDRAAAQIEQHFATKTDSRFWHYAKMIAQLKSVHPAWWVIIWVGAVAVGANYWRSLTAALSRWLGLH